jgi:hypothetical protein
LLILSLPSLLILLVEFFVRVDDLQPRVAAASQGNRVNRPDKAADKDLDKVTAGQRPAEPRTAAKRPPAGTAS